MKGSISMKVLPSYNSIQNIIPIESYYNNYNINNYNNSNQIQQNEPKNLLPKQDSSSFLLFKEKEFNNNHQKISSSISPQQINSTQINSSPIIPANNPVSERIQKKIFQRSQNIIPPQPLHVSPSQPNLNGNVINLQKYQDAANINKLNLNKINISDNLAKDISLLEVSPIEKLTSRNEQNTTSKKNNRIFLNLPSDITVRNRLYSPDINIHRNNIGNVK